MGRGGWEGHGHMSGQGGSVLAEKLADLLVHVTQEVHVRRSTAGALVLNQEVPEYELGLVFLFHHSQLQRQREQTLER